MTANSARDSNFTKEANAPHSLVESQVTIDHSQCLADEQEFRSAEIVVIDPVEVQHSVRINESGERSGAHGLLEDDGSHFE